jgi:hypothetical protein
VIQTLKAIGLHNWAAVVSDNTNVTKAARRLIHEAVPTIMPIWDCVHHIQNMIKDVSNLSEYKPVSLFCTIFYVS